MKVKIFVFMTSQLLFGCAHHYVAPQVGDTASVRFIGDGVSAIAFTFDDPNCSSTPYIMANVGSKIGGRDNYKYRLSMPRVEMDGMPEFNYAEVKIPANRDFIVYFRQVGAGYYCNFSFSFVPETDRYYQIESIQSGLMCSAKVDELVRGVGGEFSKVVVNNGIKIKSCSF